MSQSTLDDLYKKTSDYIKTFWYEQPMEIQSKISMAFRSGYNSKNEWISVEDRLPEDAERVLCCTRHGYIVQNSYEQYTDQNIDWFKKTFTHWQPLPAPPKK